MITLQLKYVFFFKTKYVILLKQCLEDNILYVKKYVVTHFMTAFSFIYKWKNLITLISLCTSLVVQFLSFINYLLELNSWSKKFLKHLMCVCISF